jgi:hypothetical protein
MVLPSVRVGKLQIIENYGKCSRTSPLRKGCKEIKIGGMIFCLLYVTGFSELPILATTNTFKQFLLCFAPSQVSHPLTSKN